MRLEKRPDGFAERPFGTGGAAFGLDERPCGTKGAALRALRSVSFGNLKSSPAARDF